MLQIIIVIASAVLVGLDQLTKWLAVTYLQGNPPFVLIDGVFEFHFSTNPGIAFGMFPGGRIFFIILTSIMLLLLFGVLMSGKLKQYKLVTISGTMIIAGGVGNLIDRIFRHEVVDFLYFKLIDFPIFNVADCFVVIGAALLLIFFVFIYSEDKGEDKKGEIVQETGEAESTQLAENFNTSENETDAKEGTIDGTADFDSDTRTNGGAD